MSHQQPYYQYPEYQDDYSPSAYPPRPQPMFYNHPDGLDGESRLSFADLDDETILPAGGAGGGASGGGGRRDYGGAEYGSGGGTRTRAGYGEKGMKKWLLIALAVIAVVGIAIGIAVWRVEEARHKSNASNSNSSSSGSLEYIKGTAGVVKSNPKDPSDFEKDSRLHQSFYGIAYTPFLSQEPWCGNSQANVTEDIQLLSQLTTRIRMYGSGCNQSALVLQAIQDTKVNMTVWLGVWIDTNTTTNTQQVEETLAVLKTYGTEHVGGVTVGNEYILDATDESTATTFIVQQMADFRSQLDALKLSTTLPVGTSDAGSVITTTLATGSDYIQANVHPFFGGVPIEQAANWTWYYFQTNDVAATTAAANNPTPYIAETGWPTASMTVENATIGAAVAGLENLQIFLDEFICTANTNATKYFFFELFDEPWKVQYGGVEPYWGMMDSNKVLKNLTLPNCPL